MQPFNLPCSNNSSTKLPVPFFVIACVLLLSFASPTSSCTEQEKSSLVDFLDGLSPDGNGGLNVSWVNSTDCCQWEGIACTSDGVVTDVMLASKGLKGSIPPSLSNLTGLLHLNLSHNSLYGSLPMELVFSSSIIVLDVSFNRLSGSLQERQSSYPGLPLKVLNMSSNFFTGQFPATTLEVMKNLIALNASNNSFMGPMPSSICNHAPSFAMLDLCYNEFSGIISPEFGNCSMLTVLKAGRNNLNGALPHELFRATSLEHLSFPNNGLQGVLDGSNLAKLSNLVVLDLGSTGLGGRMPDSIGQLRRLEELHIDNNNMSGELPLALGNCTSLMYITLRNNSFRGDLSRINFAQLDLRIADFSMNYFTGTVPESIYACSSLIALRLAYNNISGQFSPRIGNLRSLSFLSITNNSFTNITDALQKLKSCKNLTSLLIGTNFNGETIPQDEGIDGFENLQVLTIDACPLVGKIPLWLSKLTKLEILDLSNNQLTGPIPSWINGLQLLFFLDISSNKLTGDIPTTLMEMPMLQSEKNAAKLDPKFLELPVYWTQARQYRKLNAFPSVLSLCNNSLTGVIPLEIGHLKVLNILDFSSNSLSGEIPQQICNLASLEVLDLSNNQLTGELPSALSDLHFLSKFNVSNNDLQGPVPTGGQFDTFSNSSYSGNPKLCGPVLSFRCDSVEAPSASIKRRHKKTIFALSLGVFFGGLAILFLLGRLLLSIRSIKSANRNKDSNNRDIEATSFNSASKHLSDMIKGSILVMVPQSKGESNNLTFSDILKATNNFDQQNIIGCGGNGLVYRAELPNGSKLAIKKLNGEMCLMEREFTAEVEALSMAQHENLVPLWGYCIQGSSRLLIYSFMENGSLDDWLHNRDDANSFLDWPTRLKIAQGASRGLSYIHNTCKPRIVHRDIKSSNILLDREFKAYVADFGLSRLILPYNTHVTTELVGTLGYIPPEYGQAWVATLRGDIYSFGVVLLELLTGKRPVQVLTKLKELVQWVREMRSQGKEIEVLDPALRGRGHEEQMLKVLEIACKCINHNPCMRPTIQEVVHCLENVDVDQQVQI
ncbi:tyrosine-sulfated glycopeptide receptor 1-like [Phragmites australis]|uniref:tyrosine-sulfated glycopeptide receptor 1-like n=1 Tax=Phragmites australis TaxID=29695 RepID=UPI002D77A8EA|nr:tyrosine-sulfated glycopeptide receptor 1-like [Phragmites australis]